MNAEGEGEIAVASFYAFAFMNSVRAMNKPVVAARACRTWETSTTRLDAPNAGLNGMPTQYGA